MKVILLQELRGKGGEGDIVDVATGYAVNYLFPQKIAIQASKGNLKQLELRRHNIAKREETRLDSADKLLAALEGKVVRIPAKVGEEGQLFGSVTTSQIADALADLHDIVIDRKNIDTHQAIKTVGEHEAVVSIYREIKAVIQVLVVDESLPEEEAVADETADATSEEDSAAPVDEDGTGFVSEPVEAESDSGEEASEATDDSSDEGEVDGEASEEAEEAAED